MQSPVIVLRYVLFSLLVYFNILAFGFAVWELLAMRRAGVLAYGPPIFAMSNSCALIFFISIASAEPVLTHCRSAQVNFECGWAAAMSVLQTACAFDIAVKGPPVHCHLPGHETICAASTALCVITWTSSVLTSTYLLTILYLAISHASDYAAVWRTTVYKAPWFVDPAVETRSQRSLCFHCAASELKENSGTPAASEREVNEMPAAPPVTTPAQKYRPRPLAMVYPSLGSGGPYATPPAPRGSAESLRPAWARQASARRGVDHPFPPSPGAELFWSSMTTVLPSTPPVTSPVPASADVAAGSNAPPREIAEVPVDGDKPITQPAMVGKV